MKKTLPADSEILQYLYHDGGVRGEKIAMRFRWLLVVLVMALITVMFLRGQTREASWSLVPISIFIAYNLFLIFLFRRDRIGYWVRYVSVIVDVGVLSLHIFIYSAFFSDIAVAVTASIYIYFILLFLSVLRYDRKLVIFATVFVIFCFNLNYYLRNPFTIIQSITESLNENLESMDEQDARRAVQTIHDTNRRGLYLLDNLLNWTRLQTGKLKADETGVGISGNNLKRLLRFDESFSTPGTANEKGSGLGFSLIKEFVDMNQGTFSVESEEGKGTEVCIAFPESPTKNDG